MSPLTSLTDSMTHWLTDSQTLPPGCRLIAMRQHRRISLCSPLRFLAFLLCHTLSPPPLFSPHLLMPPQHHGMGRRVAGGKVEDPLPCLYFFILVWQNANLIFRALSTLPGLNDHVDLVKKNRKIFLCLNISLRKRCLSDRRTLSHSAY